MKTVKPKILVELLPMDDPTFNAGAVKTARARLTNKAAKQFTYTTEMYLGVTKAATTGAGQVTIPANSYLDVNFTLTMPLVEASYPPFIDVWHEGVLLKHYQGAENVIIVIAPDIEVGPITWV